MRYPRPIVLCATLLAGGFLFTHSWMSTAAETGSSPRIITVGEDSLGGTVRLGGSVTPEHIVNLTAQMPGDVSFVAGSEGDAFEAGDPLIELDKTALLAKRQQAEAQLASADAGYRNAMVQYNHELANPNSQGNSMLGGAPSLFSMFSDPARSMMGQGSPGMERRSNLHSFAVQVETARNSVEQALAAIRELDESLENATSYAPFDGVILKRMVEQGDIVQPGMPLVSFADVRKLQIRVEAPTRLLGVIRAGGPFQASLDGGLIVPVTVDRIFPMADAGGHTTTVKFDLPPGAEAHSGMYAEVIIPNPRAMNSSLPVIPETAIVWRGSLPAVYKVADDGSVKLRLIRVEESVSDGSVAVVSGIQVGDRILAEPAAYPRTAN